MVMKWLGTTWAELGLVTVSTFGIYAAVIVATRLGGLRSFAKMSSFDFAATVATGSLMATVAVSPSTSLANGVAAVAVLFGAQTLIARWRNRRTGKAAVDNRPLLLMAGTEMLEHNLRVGKVTRSDVLAKLRLAGVLQTSNVRAVILETTGDISVLHGDPDGPGLDPALLDGVRDARRISGQ